MSRTYLTVLVFVLACLSGYFFYRTTPRSNIPMTHGEFAGVSLTLEFATTSESREKGLGGRTSIPEDYGMLFVFPKDGLYGFWMKDTLVSLDIYWLDAQGQVVSRKERVAPESYPTAFYPTSPARYVLETRAGFGVLHGVATGTPLLLKSWPSVSN